MRSLGFGPPEPGTRFLELEVKCCRFKSEKKFQPEDFMEMLAKSTACTAAVR